MKAKEKACLECGNTFSEGRIDKKFCRDICRMSYHRARRNEKTPSIYFQVQKQLNINRKVLKRFNPKAKVTVRKTKLYDAGFNERCFTHMYKNLSGKVYWFVFEYGFTRVEGSDDHYLLVTWQKYIDRQLQL